MITWLECILVIPTPYHLSHIFWLSSSQLICFFPPGCACMCVRVCSHMYTCMHTFVPKYLMCVWDCDNHAISLKQCYLVLFSSSRFTVFTILLLWFFLRLGGMGVGSCDVDVSFRPEHSTVNYSQHSDKPLSLWNSNHPLQKETFLPWDNSSSSLWV